MNVPAAVREWLAALTSADPEENPEPVGVGEDPTTENDEASNTDPTAEVPAAEAPAAEAPAAEAPAAEAPAAEAPAAEASTPTAPEPETPLTDADRDAINTVAAENEALRQENNDLRNRIAELGGDAELGIVEEVVEDLSSEPTDEYDADADLAEQEAELARLRGE